MKIFSSRSGITILETIIVLVIGGLIISGIWMAYSEMTLNEKVRRTVNIIDKTAIATSNFLSTRNAVPADLSLRMHNENLMPSELKLDRTTPTLAIFYTPFNTPFYVSDFNGGFSRMFVIRVGVNPGSSECQRLITAVAGNMRLVKERGIVGFAFGNYMVGEQGSGSPLQQGDIPTPQEIIQECQAADIVRFFYGLRT